MISIDRLEEMTIEELQIKLKNFEEQIKLQNNFIDSLFKATNNSEWLDKSMLDDEVSEVIEKIELDYEQLDQLKKEKDKLRFPMKDTNYAVLTKEEFKQLNQLKKENEELKRQLESTKGLVTVGNKQLEEALKENEELKVINQELMKYRKYSTTCQECYEDGLEDGKTSNKELRKLRKTLAEIKEIVNICKLGNCNSECEFYNTDDCQDERLYKIKQILQKINEAQNDKN